MVRIKSKTRRREIKPLGVSERLGDIPPSRYVRREGRQKKGTDTYPLDGADHRFDGKCHDTCEDVR